MAKTARRNPELERRWRGLIEEQGRSGQSVRVFCQSRGIPEPSLYAWRRKLAIRDRERSQALSGPELFAPVRVVVEPTAKTDHRTNPTDGPIEIALGGAVVRVPRGFDESSLARVLWVLRQAAHNSDAREVRPC